MQEQDIRKIHKIIQRKEKLKEELCKVHIEASRPSYGSQDEIEIGKSGVFSGCPVNIYTLVKYLQNELLALDEKLKNLGVEIEKGE